MIYTVTLNPAIDRTVFVEEMNQNDVTRIRKTIKQAAGKGINISKILKKMGTESNAILMLAGENGKFIEQSLNNDQVSFFSIDVKGNTRENIKIVQDKIKKAIELNESGPNCDNDDLSNLHKVIDCFVKVEDIIVFTGSIPRGLPKDTYSKLIEYYNNKGLITVLDASGENLKEAIKAKPTIVKPNLIELSSLFQEKISSFEEIVDCSKKLLDLGVKEVIVTLGQNGSIYVSENKVLSVSSIPVDVKNTVGAGDSYLAGFLHGLTNNYPIIECLYFATAVAVSTVLYEGTGPKDLSLVEELKQKVINENTQKQKH